MKEYITPEQALDFYRELDDAYLFDQLDYLNSLWEPIVGNMVITELWRKKKTPIVISKVLSDYDSMIFVCYSPRTKIYTTYSKNESIPLFSIGQLIGILDLPKMEYADEEGVWNVSIDAQKYSACSLCDALWEAVKKLVVNKVLCD